jgi:hypothetical protein
MVRGNANGIGRRNGGFSNSTLADEKGQFAHPPIVAIVIFANCELPSAEDAVTCARPLNEPPDC